MCVPEMFADHRMFMLLNALIGTHLRDAHCLTPNNLIKNFKVIKKCRDKFEFLVYEMLRIKNKRPKLNTQTDSIRAKLFTECFRANLFSHFQSTYKYAFPLFPFYLFDNDDIKSSKRHAVLLSLIFLLKCISKFCKWLSILRGLLQLSR